MYIQVTSLSIIAKTMISHLKAHESFIENLGEAS